MGVEKMTETKGGDTTAALATAGDDHAPGPKAQRVLDEGRWQQADAEQAETGELRIAKLPEIGPVIATEHHDPAFEVTIGVRAVKRTDGERVTS